MKWHQPASRWAEHQQGQGLLFKPDQNGQSVYPFSDQNGAKTLPDGVAHTYIAYIREYPPPLGGFESQTRDM